MKLSFKIITILACVLLVAACAQRPQSVTPTSMPEETATTEQQNADHYPVDDAQVTLPASTGTPYPGGFEEGMNSPQQTPTSLPPAEALEIPAPEAETAIVHGVLVSAASKEPLQLVQIYAADKVPLEPNGGYVYSIQEKSSPHDETDAAGQFLLTGIKPGPFIMMMVTPFGNYGLLTDQNEEIHLDLKAGDVIDLGVVYVNWP